MRPFVMAPALAVAAAWLLAPTSALADCEPAGPLEEVLPAAPVAFVGRVVTTQGPVATFAVTEVWAGDVGGAVEVRGLSDEVGGPDVGFGAGFTEDDRTWAEGGTYLVVPFADGAVLRDHICTATTEWRPELADLRPADARILIADGESTGIPMAVVLVGVMAVAVTGASVLAFRRR